MRSDGCRASRRGGMHRIAAFAAVAGLLLLILACREPLVVRSAADGAAGGTPAPEWTVAVYMSGDNELEGRAIEDLNEMEAAAIDDSRVRVLVLIDRATGHSAAAGDWSGSRLYRVAPDPLGMSAAIVSKRLDSDRLGLSADDESELNTGAPATLAAFTAHVADAYPDSRKALVLWGPGSGYRSVSVDDGSGGDPLETGELSRALDGTHLDAVGLDLAFGAQIEIAAELAPVADTLVASQQTVGTDGWDYRRFLTELAADPDPNGAVARAADVAFAARYAGTPGACIAAIDLARISGVREALNDLSAALAGEADSAPRRDALREALFGGVESFYRTPGDLNLDLADLAAVAEDEYPAVAGDAGALRSAVQAAVTSSWCAAGAHERANGLSVHYVPLDASGYAYPPHADEYFADRIVDAPLRFASGSRWVPDETAGAGLLYRLWYEAM